jgi:GNAT superfamily N-acetyltransferase
VDELNSAPRTTGNTCERARSSYRPQTASAVLTLRSEDVERAARVIARAFHEDELNVQLYPDAETRARFAPLMFEALVHYDQLFGQVDHLPGFTAVASWMRPSETETPERLAEAGFGNLPEEVPLETLDAVFDFIGPAIARAAPEPHWHLRLLGVEPDCQGSGLGAAVMQHGIDRAADTGHAVVLETFAERTVPFYLRNGFEIIVDGIEPTSDLRFWALRLVPRR